MSRSWIGETFTSATGWNLLEDLVDLGDRMAGTEGERRGAELVADRLERVGTRNVRIEEFPIQGWERGTAGIHTPDTVEDCIGLPRSPAGTAEGELVDVGHGLPRDFEDADLSGKVVVAASDAPDWYDRYVHRREKYYHAVEAGADAFVYRNHVEGCLPPTGSVGMPENPIGPVPAVGVSKETGARLARRFEGETVTVEVDCETPEATSRNVHAELGPDTDEEVLVTSHVDAHDIAEGAMDNGAGTAALVEQAKALAAREADLDTRVHFVAFGAEEVGLVGSERLAEDYDRESVRAVLNNDGVVRGRTLALYTQGFDGLAAAANRVARRFDHPIETIPEVGPHSDHWPFVRHGVPGIHAMSRTGDEGRGWGHTYADTLDKVESRTLREQAVLLTDLAVEVASEDVSLEHAPESEMADRVRAANLAEGMKVTGDWPYDGD